MELYVVQLTKRIVMEVEAESEEEAIAYCDDETAFDKSWVLAEPEGEILEVKSV